MKQTRSDSRATIFLACREETYYSQETMIQKNTLVRVLSGEMRIFQAEKTYVLRAGDTVLFPLNLLTKVIKYPVDGQPYKSVAIHFTQESLRNYYVSHHITPMQEGSVDLKVFDSHPLLDSLFGSLLPYFMLSDELPADLAEVKVEEAISIVRAIDKGIDGILGRFDEPGKIDLVDFMEKNYVFNLPAEKFGYLTGRSLTTFKRDFKKAFNMTPQRWLTKKRLELAHYLLIEKKKKPTDVCFEVGFENLSHFSFAFKKQFGYAPTSLTNGPLNKVISTF